MKILLNDQIITNPGKSHGVLYINRAESRPNINYLEDIMEFENITENWTEVMEENKKKVNNLGDYLRWAFDDYFCGFWAKHNMLDLVVDALWEEDMDDAELYRFLDEDKLEDIHTQDVIEEIGEWFTNLIGEDENSYYFMDEGHEEPWENFKSATYEIMELFSDLNATTLEDLNDNSGYNFEDVLDSFTVDINAADEILFSHLPN